jgi:hypothetical protein
MADKNNALMKLLDEIDALCKAYCGKKAESEQWLTTVDRLDRLNKLRHRARTIAMEGKR